MEVEVDIEPLSGGLTPLSAKLAAYGESLRRLKRAEEERNGDSQVLEDGALGPHATFARDGSRSSGSPRIRALESPRTTNQSRSRIRQPRRPTTVDSGL